VNKNFSIFYPETNTLRKGLNSFLFIIKNLNLTKIFSRTVKPAFRDSRDILWLRDIPTPNVKGKQRIQFSKNLLKGVYGGYTVIYIMLQIAFYMGIREIYLLGIDFNFRISPSTGEKTSAGEILLKNDGEVNHFHPDYRKQGELWTMPRLMNHDRDFS